MQLLTLADLARPDEQISPLINQAQKLGQIWLEFLKQDTEPYTYTVTDGGEKERSAGIHASEMSDCMLKLVYAISGVERRPDAKSMDANMKLRFRTGTALHAMIQTDFERMCKWYSAHHSSSGWGLTFERELKVKSHLQEVAQAWDLSSSCDGAFTFWRASQEPTPNVVWTPYLRVGLEIKTSSGPAYDDRKKPEPKHLQQTCLYQATLNLPLMWVLYYNKSNSNFTTPYSPWLYKFDKNLWTNELEMRFAKAHHLAETGKMPERTEGMHCGWCPFSWLCQPKVLNKPSFTGVPLISTGMLTKRP